MFSFRTIFPPREITSRWRVAHRVSSAVSINTTHSSRLCSNPSLAPVEHERAAAFAPSPPHKVNIDNLWYQIPTTFSVPYALGQSLSGGLALSEPVNTAAAAGVTPTVLSPSLVAFLQVAPPLAAQVVFLSPLSAMKQFAKTGTTGDVSCIPYAAMCANGALWVVYGALKGDMTIIVPNMSGFFFGAYYVKTFSRYAPDNVSMAPYYGGIAAMMSSVLGAAMCLDTGAAIDAIGLSGCAVVAVMFGGPLGSIKTVLKDKNTNSLPVPFTAAAFINCLCWVSYGSLVIDDIYVWGPNLAGLIASSAQIGLYAKFGLPK
jgi:uncharacterized protein with PQ loop repeat